MILIATTFGNQVDDGALRLTELRAEAIALDAKLLNGIDGWKDQQFDWLPFTDMSTLESSPVPRAAKDPAVETPGTIVANEA